jgi:hypothetical protein
MSFNRAQIFIILAMLVSACGQNETALPDSNEPVSLTVEATAAYTPSLPPIETPPPTETPTQIPSYTPVPIYSVLRAEVLSRANCRYGPGWPYLYKYGLLKGNNIEVIGRVLYSNWVYVQAIGGSNPCWVRADLLDIHGDIDSLEPVYPDKALLPISPYYPKTTVLEIKREDNLIYVRWLEVPISPGDFENEQMQGYIIEVWRCESGQYIFEPLATNYAEISFIDENGCDLPSQGRIFVQEKHGFAGPAEIPWPPYE